MKKHLFLTSLLFLGTVVSQAQWQPDVRLTNDSAVSNTSYSNAWCVAANGNLVHVVWYDNRDGNNEIYYKRSTDGGVSWGADTRHTNNIDDSYYPSIAVSGSVVHVVWFDERDGNPEIYYKRSSDAGVSWGADTRLTNNTLTQWFPSITVSGSDVHIVWGDLRDGNREIYYKRSTDAGISWGADTRLTNNTADSDEPSVSVSGSIIHVAWQDQRDGNPEMYYKRSTDAGVSWGADIRLTNNASTSTTTSVTVSDTVVHVVWRDSRDGNNEIYYKRSADAGVSWAADTRLTNNTSNSVNPSVSVSGLVVHVVWRDLRDGNNEIYYKRSTDAGVSWAADTRLTNNTGNSISSFVAVSGSVVHVVWQDDRDGNFEIYYKHDPTGNVVGIDDFFLNQNALQFSPNPFSNEIRVNSSNNELCEIIIYDIASRKLLQQQFINTVTLNTSQFAKGIYIYEVRNKNGSRKKGKVVKD